MLAICADALRRRELIERAARPARFGGGALGIASGRLPDAHATAALGRVREAGGGVLLADWAALERDPGLAASFAHAVVVDPPPSERLDVAAAAGEGYLHLVAGPAEAEFALRVHADDWPSRAWLASVFRELRSAGDAPSVRDALVGSRRAHPLSPEVAARSARVLAELGLVSWARSDGPAALRVVSSEATDLERSTAYGAYRRRHEETRRFLTRARQSRRPRPS